ncbi:hypothetical protein GYMLUDRAFT_78476 [Collybiopsis luxurians FD-317 M1]|uniref:Serine--tRNA ligase n=1 Tax=Collybiopsis luxurians FD-317 M1 TaxID=944289 RepID=A0A0D0BM98_9AGAR|nr:hypothetical protein GYMLUDRAFT_78476 [Collybiopsis luxurians FD-317 M1]
MTSADVGSPLINTFISVDFNANGLSKQVNAVQKKFVKEPADNLIVKKKVPDAQVEAKQKGTKDFEALMRKKASGIGNSWAYIMPHHEVLLGLDAMDLNRVAKVAGHRGYYLTNEGIELNQALILYASILQKKDQFDKELYKVIADKDKKYLIATSEQHILAFHTDEWIEKSQLPFEKVEQFIVDDLEKSWEVLSKPWVEISSSEYCSAMRYDLEAWFPFQKGYKELGLCSNFMDYHAHWLEVRCSLKTKDQASKLYYHMLNGMLVATERALCCLVENYQTPEIHSFIYSPWVKELPKGLQKKTA